MWEIFEEDYTDPCGGSVYSQTQGICRKEDGFTLLNHRIDREGRQTFVCRGDFGEFKFYASRWKGELFHKGELLDTYTVWVNSNPDTGYMDKEVHRRLVLAYAKDIETGLFSFPLGKILNTPIKDVLFNISRTPWLSELMHAEEISP